MSSDPALKDIGKKNGLLLWRVNHLELDEVPKAEQGTFYTGDAYIALFQKNSETWDVHFWLGNEASLDEITVAPIKAVEIDNALGGIPTQHREIQGHESPLFVSYFPEGIRYVAGGHDCGTNHVEDKFANFVPRLYHCKGKRNVRFSQVEKTITSLNLGDVFILDTGKDIYVWEPPHSGNLERLKGVNMAKSIADVERIGASHVHIIRDDWNKNTAFWNHFGGLDKISMVAEARDDDDNYWKRLSEQITLWKVSDASGELRINIAGYGDEIKKKMLKSEDAFILDALNGGVYIWVGKNCTAQERENAMVWGERYIRQKHLPRWTQVTRVLESTEPAGFTQWFSEWEDVKKKNTFEPKLFHVSDETGQLRVEELANFDQSDLDIDDVMILDALHSIYVWVGSKANAREKKEAEATAKKYLQQGKLPRHKNTAIETIYQGKETSTFKKFFPSWDENLFQLDAQAVLNMRKLRFH